MIMLSPFALIHVLISQERDEVQMETALIVTCGLIIFGIGLLILAVVLDREE